MKNRINLPLLKLLPLLVIFAAALLLLGAARSQVYADGGTCTRAGKVTTINGKVACDCSQQFNGGDCTCIYQCGQLEE